ncbi:hypothetical protein LguiA_006350 [Lonicera macranthoides]
MKKTYKSQIEEIEEKRSYRPAKLQPVVPHPAQPAPSPKLATWCCLASHSASLLL